MPGERPVDNDALLRRHGLLVTAQRLAVLGALADRPHSTAEDIYLVVQADIGSVSRKTVYEALGALVEKGLLRRIQIAGSPARYEDRVGDNHHHLVCRSCGRMVDVDCVVGDAPCLFAADDAGYQIDRTEVVYWGRCPACVPPAAAGAERGAGVPGAEASGTPGGRGRARRTGRHRTGASAPRSHVVSKATDP